MHSCLSLHKFLALYFACCFFLVPHISTYDVFVTEGQDDVAHVIFNRTGGNLAIRSRIAASTVQTAGIQSGVHALFMILLLV